MAPLGFGIFIQKQQKLTSPYTVPYTAFNNFELQALIKYFILGTMIKGAPENVKLEFRDGAQLVIL